MHGTSAVCCPGTDAAEGLMRAGTKRGSAGTENKVFVAIVVCLTI